ncbi:type II CAAX endopeptidase family protein [Emticicia sp. BO119]|uniref:type II CAAX endopeptidase family protein n=1 Tax=Emticicia sp. BO119 TaxID=2757768 RepID=UPI0015EFE0AE|nr:type II CAAX endopeptidase family protein [Emticicia sp. BO119]MBA4848960.1 CPBP family intramembrane metalloprotease [Emticicia sp. BO119]
MKQLVTFFVLSYCISWFIWLPFYGHLFGLNNLYVIPYQHAIGGLGPLLASFLTTWIYLKKDGLKVLLKQSFRLKPLIYLCTALFSPFLLAVFAAVINNLIAKTPVNLSALFTVREFPHLNTLTFFIYNLVFFGFGEEVGWRGFALPRIQAKNTALAASIFLSFFWALWHWPLFFYRPNYMTMGITGAIGWFFSLLTGSVLLTWLYNASRASILACAVFHSTVDIVFTADFADNAIINTMGFLITIWGILIIVIFKADNLSSNKRQVLP